MSDKKIKLFNYEMSDLYTKSLFSSCKFSSVVASYSRVACDVEKFTNDKLESMSKYGMGVVYTKTNKGEIFLKPTEEYRDRIIKKYYNSNHKKLNKVVEKNLQKNKIVILVDCHSFSENQIMEQKKQNCFARYLHRNKSRVVF